MLLKYILILMSDPILCRINYFATTVHHPKIKAAISGKNETRVITLFEVLGYTLGEDFVRQYPLAELFVLDFAFVKERFAIEVDGEYHEQKHMKRKDKIRDKYLRENGWLILRIKDKDLWGYRLSFYKNLIREVVEERRIQYQGGRLYDVAFYKFNASDYE